MDDQFGEPIGWGFVARSEGYRSQVGTLCGIELEGDVRGVVVVEHNETRKYFDELDDEFFAQFSAINVNDIDVVSRDFSPYEVDAVTGATVTSQVIFDTIWKSFEVQQNVD